MLHHDENERRMLALSGLRNNAIRQLRLPSSTPDANMMIGVIEHGGGCTLSVAEDGVISYRGSLRFSNLWLPT